MEKKPSNQDVAPAEPGQNDAASNENIISSDPPKVPLPQNHSTSLQHGEVMALSERPDSPVVEPAIIPSENIGESIEKQQDAPTTSPQPLLTSLLSAFAQPEEKIHAAVSKHFSPGQEAFKLEDLKPVTESVGQVLDCDLSPSIPYVVSRLSTPAISFLDYVRTIQEWLNTGPEISSMVNIRDTLPKPEEKSPSPIVPLKEEEDVSVSLPPTTLVEHSEEGPSAKNPSAQMFSTEFLANFGKIQAAFDAVSYGRPTFKVSKVPGFFLQLLEITQLSLSDTANPQASQTEVIDSMLNSLTEPDSISLTQFAEFLETCFSDNPRFGISKRPSGDRGSVSEREPTAQVEEDSSAKTKGLKEIFAFYCRQQLLIGKKATFEQLKTVLSNMNLGEFMKFCKDFAVPLSATKIKELFKKTAKLSKELDWTSFNTILQKLANEIVDEKVSSLAEEAASLPTDSGCCGQCCILPSADIPARDLIPKEGLIKKRTPLLSGRSYKKNPNIPARNKTEVERELSALKQKSEETRLLEFLAFIGCADPSKFRKRMAGMALPFNTRDKDYRIPLNEGSRKYKFVPNKSPGEIRQAIEEVNKRRTEEKLRRSKESQEKYIKNRQILERIHQKQLRQQNVITSIEPDKETPEEVPAKILPVQPNTETIPSKRKEITWDLLKDLTYDDINSGYNNKGDDEFQPAALLAGENEDSAEDEEILRKLQGKRSSPHLKKGLLALQSEENNKVSASVSKPVQKYSLIRNKAPLNKLIRVNKSVEHRTLEKERSGIIAAAGAQEENTEEPKVSHRYGGAGRYGKVVHRQQQDQLADPLTVASMLKERLVPGGRSVKQLRHDFKYNNDISREIIGRAQQIEDQQKEREGQNFSKILSLQNRQLERRLNLLAKK